MGSLLLLCLLPTLSTGSPSVWPGNMSIGEPRRMHLSLHVWPYIGSSALHLGAPGGVPGAQGLTGEYSSTPLGGRTWEACSRESTAGIPSASSQGLAPLRPEQALCLPGLCLPHCTVLAHSGTCISIACGMQDHDFASSVSLNQHLARHGNWINICREELINLVALL